MSVVSYRHYTSTYILSQTVQLCLTDITRLHMSCHRHINCVLQISPAYICLVTDISVVSYRHHTPTYVLSQTQQSYLTDITHLHISCHRHISCVLQTSHVFICLVTDTSVVSYRHHTPTYFLSWTHQLCLTDITRLHMSCHRYMYFNCVLQTSHVYISLVTDTTIVSYRYHTPTYGLSQTYQLCHTDIKRLHMSHYRHINCVLHTSHAYMSCHRHINCVLEKSHVYIWLNTDTSIASNRHHKSTYVLSQIYQLWLTDIIRLHMSCQSNRKCVLQTSHVYIYLVTDTPVVSYRHHTPTYFLSQTQQLCFCRHYTPTYVLS